MLLNKNAMLGTKTLKQVTINGEDIKAILTNEGIIFTSPFTGKHGLNEREWNPRVQAHWEGFIFNQPKNK